MIIEQILKEKISGFEKIDKDLDELKKQDLSNKNITTENKLMVGTVAKGLLDIFSGKNEEKYINKNDKNPENNLRDILFSYYSNNFSVDNINKLWDTAQKLAKNNNVIDYSYIYKGEHISCGKDIGASTSYYLFLPLIRDCIYDLYKLDKAYTSGYFNDEEFKDDEIYYLEFSKIEESLIKGIMRFKGYSLRSPFDIDGAIESLKDKDFTYGTNKAMTLEQIVEIEKVIDITDKNINPNRDTIHINENPIIDIRRINYNTMNRDLTQFFNINQI